MNKTLYLKPGDEEVWDKAKRTALVLGGNIGQVIMSSLERYCLENEKRMELIEKVIAETEPRA